MLAMWLQCAGLGRADIEITIAKRSGEIVFFFLDQAGAQLEMYICVYDSHCKPVQNCVFLFSIQVGFLCEQHRFSKHEDHVSIA